MSHVGTLWDKVGHFGTLHCPNLDGHDERMARIEQVEHVTAESARHPGHLSIRVILVQTSAWKLSEPGLPG